MTSRAERSLPWLFMVLLAGLLAVAGWQWHGRPPVSADLMALVPGAAPDPLVQQAEQRMQAPLSREMLVLVGNAGQEQAVALAQNLATQWQASGLFEQVQWSVQADLPALREQLLQGRLAMLSPADRVQLETAPQAFIQQRLQSLFDPFTGFSLVPNQDDWLGLTQRIQNSQPQHGSVQLDLASGALVAQGDGKAWVLLRARTAGNAFDLNLPVKVAALLAQAREQAASGGSQLLAASGLLYAANGQLQAQREITWVGGGATLGILMMLLLAFRRWRVLLAFLPVLVGVLAGTTLCVAVFGQVHVMTLVLGASLIGVAVDYPLHYLSKAWSLRPWHSWAALRLTRAGLALSLATSCIGYLALAFTPFPALTQIALFSAGGLCGAWLTATCLLPALLARTELRPAAWPLALAQRLIDLRLALLRRVNSYVLLAVLLAACLGGIYHLQVRNDLRQWIDSSPELMDQAKAVARITGFQPTSQFFLVQGRDEDELLERERALTERLAPLVAEHRLQSYLALSQLVAPEREQVRTRQALQGLQTYWQPLASAGVPPEALARELATLQAMPVMTIDQALAGPLGEPYRLLWLGNTGNGVASTVSLQGLGNAQELARLADGLPGVHWVDRLGELNRVFAQTQVSAAELKLASCGLILLLLIWPFGLGGAVRLVALPLLAALCSLAGLGWLGQPLTLFSVFGLLLATAISVDYAILMREQVGGAATSLLGTLLAAITTWLSFGLLMVSATPAVSNFGLSVSLGLAFSFLLAPWAAPRAGKVHR